MTARKSGSPATRKRTESASAAEVDQAAGLALNEHGACVPQPSTNPDITEKN